MGKTIAVTVLLMSVMASFRAIGGMTPPTSSRTNQVAGDERNDAVVLNGHRYLLCTERLTWKDAKAACEGKGGHLVTFGDTSERDFVLQLIGSSSVEDVWLGLVAKDWQTHKIAKVKTVGSQKQFYELEGNDFSWVDGKRGLRLWKNGVVAEVDAEGSQMLCVHFGAKDGRAQWDGNADAWRPYICEWDR